MSEALASLLDPVTPSEFCTDYYSIKPIYIGNCPNKFVDLFSWEALNKVLNSSHSPHPTMKMVLEGKPVLVTDASSIIDRCRHGASLVIEEMHRYDSKVGKLAA